MKLENRTLTLDANLTNEDINELASQIVLNIDDIDKVVLENETNGIASSALFALLQSIKNKKTDIEIPFLNNYEKIGNMGKVLFIR